MVFPPFVYVCVDIRVRLWERNGCKNEQRQHYSQLSVGVGDVFMCWLCDICFACVSLCAFFSVIAVISGEPREEELCIFYIGCMQGYAVHLYLYCELGASATSPGVKG